MMRTTITLRLATDDDIPRQTELLNLAAAEPVTVDQVRSWRHNESPTRIAQRWFAVTPDGASIGFGSALRDDWMAPGIFWLNVVVEPHARRQGAGALLLAAVTRFAMEQGATALRAETRDNDPAGRSFAERFGFVAERHTFESTLDLHSFDEQPFIGALTAAQASGIRFFSMAEIGDTPQTRQALYTLMRDVALDVPGGSEASAWPFEVFEKQIFGSPHYLADGQFAAADGERWIGLAAIQRTATTNAAYNALTGTLREYRGRGIALALKLLTIRAAKRYGLDYLRTNNDALNAPMLAINRKLGYRSEPGYFRLLRTL